MSLLQSGERIHGTLIEPTALGGALRGTIDGKVSPSGEIEFVKTYAGTPGQALPIRYLGRIRGNFKSIHGSWEIQGSRGSFEMTRGETGPPSP